MLLHILSWVATFIIILAATFSLAVALYFLAELVEENSVTASKVIRWMIIIDAALFLLLPIFESFPITLVISGLVAQLCHYMLMRTFPAIQIKSPWFAGTIILFLVNHYLAFRHFTEHYYAFNEAFAFFFLFMWLVPMALLVSLSANDMVLPTYSDSASSLGRSSENSFMNNQRRKQGSSLKTFLTYVKEEYLPIIGLGAKKAF
ncbi:hypothetical protein RvY_12539 [Ramazzottius varieornatus]|uniref:Protein TEX261 n=1 Tax=Ramazzottius varieornatus TaxID=947166 RepID=A0A1D1VJU5_RAMVA|nr:hypothetical protein RvY_12539 [Ramazzottius varieornatus]